MECIIPRRGIPSFTPPTPSVYYLYNEGNEYTNITGGYIQGNSTMFNRTPTGAFTKNTDNLYSLTGTSLYKCYVLQSTNKIDVSGYSFINIDWEGNGNARQTTIVPLEITGTYYIAMGYGYYDNGKDIFALQLDDRENIKINSGISGQSIINSQVSHSSSHFVKIYRIWLD